MIPSLSVFVSVSLSHGKHFIRQGNVFLRNISTVKPKKSFNVQHLAKGDPLPPFNGKPRLFSMRYSPFSHRVSLALQAKGIDYEVVYIDVVHKPEWFSSKSFFKNLPAFEVNDGVCIIESSPIVQYLDEVYPERPLLPKDPLMKTYDRILADSSIHMHTMVVEAIKGLQEVTDMQISRYFKSLDLIQNHLQLRGSRFLGGDQPGYADYMIWPWFERMPSLNLMLSDQKHKLLLEYTNQMKQDPAVENCSLPTEGYVKFHSSYRELLERFSMANSKKKASL